MSSQTVDGFLNEFAAVHAELHKLWTAAVGTSGYDKAAWHTLDNALAKFGRAAAREAGVPDETPLVGGR